MITCYLKICIKYFFLIVFLTSCEKKTFSELDKNIEELIKWSLLDESEYQSINYTPVSSRTLADLLSLHEYENIVHPKKGILIGYFSYENNKMVLTESNKDLLILIAKAQIYENFDILIQSNDIKSNLNDIINEIRIILLSNGVKSNNIRLNSIVDISQDFVIKIIKLL
ncbi:MAG: hypothetical protein CFH33_01207 [Alphaproteobacteria bacterium MarineAlpha9_Bin3]|nr:MAG: hypothetical protein CFH33_01207 [Alphaproteobacteria bacterium MarineAlpha9_Bin3]|tara:strand:- start:10687 stop:11193 length:507 start_codon:yes stop_codon:yes gene_type:complete